MCTAQVNGDSVPCGETEGLELHETWGENHSTTKGKFQQRILLCNLHHALIEDRGHQAALMLDQYRPSVLSVDVALEIQYAGGYQAWLTKWGLDDSRSGIMVFNGPQVSDYE